MRQSVKDAMNFIYVENETRWDAANMNGGNGML
jgi:hypothetical protein